MIQVALAQAAVNFILGKTIDGALSAVGEDTYKAALGKLKGFLSWKFAGKPELEKVEQNPEPLVQVINETIDQQPNFKDELEALVNELQKSLSNSPEAEIFYNNVGSVGNFQGANISGGQAAGRDAIGGNQNINYFR